MDKKITDISVMYTTDEDGYTLWIVHSGTPADYLAPNRKTWHLGALNEEQAMREAREKFPACVIHRTR